MCLGPLRDLYGTPFGLERPYWGPRRSVGSPGGPDLGPTTTGWFTSIHSTVILFSEIFQIRYQYKMRGRVSYVDILSEIIHKICTYLYIFYSYSIAWIIMIIDHIFHNVINGDGDTHHSAFLKQAPCQCWPTQTPWWAGHVPLVNLPFRFHFLPRRPCFSTKDLDPFGN